MAKEKSLGVINILVIHFNVIYFYSNYG